MYYKVVIHETGRNNLKEEPQTFNVETKTTKTLEEIKEFLVDRYGKIPKRRMNNTIFVDPDAQPIGFLHSFWNRDISHNSHKWYQTDWVAVVKVNEEPVLVN